MNKSKIYMFICITVLVVSVIGGTIAYYREVLFDSDISTITHGLDYYINYTKGQNITSGELVATDNYAEGKSTSVKLWKKDNTYDLYGHIYLDITSIGTNLSNSESLKYTVVNNNNIIGEGTLEGSESGDSILLAGNIPLQTSEQIYTIYIWIDSGTTLDSSIESESLSISVRCEVTMKTIAIPVNLISHIKNLYTSGTPTLITQGTSEDSYYYSYQDTGSTWGLMNDGLTIDTTQDATTTGLAKVVTDTTALTSGTEGNIRFFGPSDSVNNYIYFNCDNYSNQSASTCELWRIIGIVDGKVKIIKNDSIGNLSWDYDYNDDQFSTSYTNNWNTSSLKTLLNGAYYNNVDTIYYNFLDTGGTGESSEAKKNNIVQFLPYVSNSTSAISVANYLSIELKFNTNNIGITEATRNNNLISESTWYLGEKSSASGLYPNDIYNHERQNIVGTTILSGNPFTINANIGLMYASDYGYGTDLTKCSDNIYKYNNSTNSYACRANNWLFNSAYQWLITPNSSSSLYAWYVSSSGNVYSNYSVFNTNYGVRPVLYLNTELAIESGHEGTSTDPYRISV